MWIWHLGGHEESEMLIEVVICITESDLHDSSFSFILLLEQNWI